MARRRRRKKGSAADGVLVIAFLFIALFMLNGHMFSGLLLLIIFVFIIIMVMLIFGELIVKSIKSANAKPTSYVNKRCTEPYKANSTPEPDIYLFRKENKAKEEQKPRTWNKEILNALEWKRFEAVVSKYYQLKGYDSKTTRTGADGGIDIVLRKNGVEKPIAIVQCKAWRANIGVKAIRELFGIMAAEEVKNGVFITTSGYTKEAMQFADNKKIQLLTGSGFLDRIKALSKTQQIELLKYATKGDYRTPTCPNCDIKMTKRHARNNPDNEFWGCKNYRNGCRQTFQIRKNK